MTYPNGSGFAADEPREPVGTVGSSATTGAPTGTTVPPAPAAPLPPPPRTDFSDGESSQTSMKDKASESAQAGREAAGEVAQTAVDKAKTVAEETQRQARDLAEEARSQVANEASRHHRNAAASLHSLGDELTSMAQHSDQPGLASELASQGGRRAHDLASWLDQREPGDLLDDVRNFARQRPGTFLLGALAAGVVAGRLTRGAVAVHRDSDDQTSLPANQSAAAPVTPAEPASPYAATVQTPIAGAYPS
jgi:hypothetical protein